MQGRSEQKSRCRWAPRAIANSLAARTSSRLCHRNSTCIVTRLAVHVADEYEVACDGSFHERHHMLLRRCGAILSALPYAAPRSATLKGEYRMKGALALDTDA